MTSVEATFTLMLLLFGALLLVQGVPEVVRYRRWRNSR